MLFARYKEIRVEPGKYRVGECPTLIDEVVDLTPGSPDLNKNRSTYR
jgi:hypothetical protein